MAKPYDPNAGNAARLQLEQAVDELEACERELARRDITPARRRVSNAKRDDLKSRIAALAREWQRESGTGDGKPKRQHITAAQAKAMRRIKNWRSRRTTAQANPNGQRVPNGWGTSSAIYVSPPAARTHACHGYTPPPSGTNGSPE